MGQGIALYARVSSDRQVQEGTVESQLEALRSYAREQQWEIDPDLVFVDNGISGATLVRPALDALRDKAVAGQVAKVIVLCPDRLARKSAHQLVLVEEFQRLGVEILFTNKAVGDSAEDQLLLQIQGVIAEYEREKFKERSRRGMIHKAKCGNVNALGSAPYGYVYVKKTETEGAKYLIHSEEAAVVRKIFHWYVHERKSLWAISDELKRLGIKAPKGGERWSPATLHGIFRNPAYVGRAAFHRKVTVERTLINKAARERRIYPKKAKSSYRHLPENEWITIPVPAIIDEETFSRLNSIGEENLKWAGRNNRRHQYLLSSLAYCQECGYAIYGIGTTPPRKPLRYYRCMGMDAGRWQNHKRVCSQRPAPVPVIDDMLWDQTKKIVNDSGARTEGVHGKS